MFSEIDYLFLLVVLSISGGQKEAAILAFRGSMSTKWTRVVIRATARFVRILPF
ncbi:MAG: hypothetical protein ACE5G1_07830 [bacterium]